MNYRFLEDEDSHEISLQSLTADEYEHIRRFILAINDKKCVEYRIDNIIWLV